MSCLEDVLKWVWSAQAVVRGWGSCAPGHGSVSSKHFFITWCCWLKLFFFFFFFSHRVPKYLGWEGSSGDHPEQPPPTRQGHLELGHRDTSRWGWENPEPPWAAQGSATSVGRKFFLRLRWNLLSFTFSLHCSFSCHQNQSGTLLWHLPWGCLYGFNNWILFSS